MDTYLAIARSAASPRRQRVFDWNKAAGIIKDKPTATYSAGLSEDFEYTCGKIFERGKPVLNDYTYLSSNWAIPTLVVEESDGKYDEIDCWLWEEDCKWNEDTKWPESALAILTVNEAENKTEEKEDVRIIDI